jgi:hypothetical protein
MKTGDRLVVDEAFISLAKNMVKNRFPDWIPGDSIPPKKLDPEIVESRKNRKGTLIGLLRKFITVETRLSEFLLKKQNESEDMTIKYLTQNFRGDEEKHIRGCQIILTALQGEGWPPPLQQHRNLEIIQSHKGRLQHIVGLLKDVLLSCENETRKHVFGLLLNTRERELRDIEFAFVT